MKNSILLIFLLACSYTFESCQELNANEASTTVDPKKDYWYNGEAEISSFNLTQARYGELHKGKAVLVFVTEPFSMRNKAKADNPSKDDPSILKLNFTKKFNTGIYPYSMMTSTFLPFSNGEHSLKISSSSQEWCGHTYMEMNNESKFNFDIASYFEGESTEKSLSKAHLEDDIWSKIRLDYNKLPIGNFEMIPSFFSLRMMHEKLEAYSCVASIEESDQNMSYSIRYPKLERSLTIQFEKQFPNKIIGWEETHYSGYGTKRQLLTTRAERIASIKSAYWNKNSNKDASLREELGLE